MMSNLLLELKTYTLRDNWGAVTVTTTLTTTQLPGVPEDWQTLNCSNGNVKGLQRQQEKPDLPKEAPPASSYSLHDGD